MDAAGSCWQLITGVGTLTAVVLLLEMLYWIGKNLFVYILAEPLGFTVPFAKLGEWAVITGATDGIGKAYAFDLARRGCNIILISRSEEKLQKVAKEIESVHGVKTKIIVANFSHVEGVYEHIKRELDGLEIGVLVNNVGVTYPNPEFLADLPGGTEFLNAMINCNVLSQTHMTSIVLPGMLARRSGAVISLSSACGDIPIPLLSVYSATKAYNDFLSRALQQEYADRGLIFQSVLPWIVSTNMTNNARLSFLVLDAKLYARACLNTVGFFTRTHGHPAHALQNWLLKNFFPSRLSQHLIKSHCIRSRDKAHRKMKAKTR
ncbi:very-long-chain 3-oxoacyl-CoA reductase-B-like [Paramacrobiotus metropolitanus]|uniref:very-long-chain 3-oxoacyl-CoA reductase-B-like n=1 Tax=Paramacrobiotus metropolitanus TaxID=2943436 RepID=UPI002445D7A3|nr:very-long-chain 3-oxoacyl-CoA reductase-B-like [Paramacrobiotus metropolitanus]